MPGALDLGDRRPVAEVVFAGDQASLRFSIGIILVFVLFEAKTGPLNLPKMIFVVISVEIFQMNLSWLELLEDSCYSTTSSILTVG